jgi:hypothetical protein
MSGAISSSNLIGELAGVFVAGHSGANVKNIGIVGMAGGGGNHNFGIQGQLLAMTSQPPGDAAVWGDAENAGGAYGVYGTSSSSTGYGGYFYNSAGGYAGAFVGGNVGIGTAAPAQILDINSGAYSDILFARNPSYTSFNALSLNGKVTDAGITGFFAGSNVDSNLYIQATSGGGIVFRTNGNTLQSIITSSGNFGIGNFSPSYTLQVNGSVAGTSPYVNTSDIRFKKNVQPLDLGLNIVTQMRPVSFEWDDKALNEWNYRSLSAKERALIGSRPEHEDPAMQGKQMGFVAQEIEKILPSVVVTEPNADNIKGMKYSELIPVLVKAIQELKADNDNLHKQLDALESKH